ncbi:MAG: hypothetical protein RLZ98_82 [Pseudomonadota bacterium]|jgi:ABC-2 type transport system permease protein
MTGAGTLGWFAAHEIRLAWRDWLSMMTAGQRGLERWAIVVVAAFVGLLHLLAFAVLGGPLGDGEAPEQQLLAVTTAMIALALFMMVSQALEHVTRAFYGRSDMELILSSPARAERVFAVRIVAVAISTAMMAVLLAAPFINAAAVLDGPGWLAAYAVLFAAGAIATALSVVMTLALFAVCGPRRTRIAAQIIAAMIGAGFIIGIQVIAIFSSGSLSRLDAIASAETLQRLPAGDSLLWLPARAAIGDPLSLAFMVTVSVALLIAAIMVSANRFAGLVLAAGGIEEAGAAKASPAIRPIRSRGARQVLRQKEWTLLARDPWLVSQSLMQILYLLPPALLLWQSYGEAAGVVVVLAPVLVMALGQLAGGLSWLAVSGEDAPDLVATAPVAAGLETRAKVEAVLAVIAAVAAPLLAAIVWIAPFGALVVALGVLAAAGSAIAIQLWFRVASSRSQFRRRQTASKASTFAEAYSSVMWAGASSLAAAHSWFCLVFVVLAVAILGFAWLVSPARQRIVSRTE